MKKAFAIILGLVFSCAAFSANPINSDIKKLIEPPAPVRNEKFNMYTGESLIKDCVNLKEGCIRFIDGLLQRDLWESAMNDRKVSYCIPKNQTIADIAAQTRRYFFDTPVIASPAMKVIYGLNKAYPCTF